LVAAPAESSRSEIVIIISRLGTLLDESGARRSKEEE
jgi:hypothetical protein